MSQVLTKKDVLIKKYEILQRDLTNIVEIDIFPSVDDIDIEDVAILMNMFFDNSRPLHENVKQFSLANCVPLSDEQIDQIVPIVSKFLEFLNCVIFVK